MLATLEHHYHRLTDAASRRWPRRPPPASRLAVCRIVSHRGEHDNVGCLENSLEAFDTALGAGVWGVELDVRWTADLIPVVFHDADTQRLFGQKITIDATPMEQLRQRYPQIPTLEEVVTRYGGRVHLMIEIKTSVMPYPFVQRRRLQRILKELAPGDDFHLMSLHPDLFACFDLFPARTFVPIAQVDTAGTGRRAASYGWGGVAGHWLLTGRRQIDRLHETDLGVGTGFADCKQTLYREVARGVDWIFSNRAARMQAICNSVAGR